MDLDGDIDIFGAFRFSDTIFFFESLLAQDTPDTGGTGELIIYNGVSTRANGKNDFFKIENIESFADNKVEIFNRWGQKVFEITDYDNDNAARRFAGEGNVGSAGSLVAGTYYYVILAGNTEYTGFLHLRR
ncbi:gliding motility-associated C-terminal domain-containing protein [Fulvivirga ligni]|uniref:gliding motility-associated C-terminal domain-containing protein n=1 Tax=Fulvivirga ligni TaxID=2904246 RepID=UPI001F31CC98|nr:gliding motility-associated C-terminal domain-containing protein [Fulvivirga ligni]UII22201.1 gliding motility-associated C-terminal domain-containing protein [Fulvivirga ligni]